MISDDELDVTVGDVDKGGPGEDLSLWRRWERLRLAYNAALTAEVAAFVAIFGVRGSAERFLGFCGVCAVFANVCFCAGPVTEGWLRFLGVRTPWPTRVLFGAGLILSIGLCGLALLGYRFPFMP